jgi:FkbM family methyltransferase
LAILVAVVPALFCSMTLFVEEPTQIPSWTADWTLLQVHVQQKQYSVAATPPPPSHIDTLLAYQWHCPNYTLTEANATNTTVQTYKMPLFTWHIGRDLYERRGQYVVNSRKDDHRTHMLQGILVHSVVQPAIVLDVGAGDGFLSLMTATMGHTAIVFETDITMVEYMCKSKVLNNFSDSLMSIYPLAVSSQVVMTQVYNHSMSNTTNPSTATTTTNDNSQSLSNNHSSESTPHETKIHTVSLDYFAQEKGWFDNTTTAAQPYIALLKVYHDVPEVLQGASRLLHSRFIHNLFLEMEFPVERHHVIPNTTRATLHLIRNAGYYLHRIDAWFGPIQASPWKNDDHMIEHLLQSVRKSGRSHRSAKMWWTLFPVP